MPDNESEIDVLDPRFPIRLTASPAIFDDMLETRPDRACARGVADRARTQDSEHQERFVTPRWVPERAHEDTAVDMALPRGWWKDTPTREGMPKPEEYDTFIAASDLTEKAETEAAERHLLRRSRRAIGRLLAITQGEK